MKLGLFYVRCAKVKENKYVDSLHRKPEIVRSLFFVVILFLLLIILHYFLIFELGERERETEKENGRWCDASASDHRERHDDDSCEGGSEETAMAFCTTHWC